MSINVATAKPVTLTTNGTSTTYYYDANGGNKYYTYNGSTYTEVTDTQLIQDINVISNQRFPNTPSTLTNNTNVSSTNPDNIESQPAGGGIADINVALGNKRTLNLGALSYPQKVSENDPGDSILFTPAEINVRSGVLGGGTNFIGGGNNGNNANRRLFTAVGGSTVRLNIQSPISDMNNVSWQENRVDALSGVMYNAAYNALSSTKNGAVGAWEAVQKGGNELISNMSDLAGFFNQSGLYKQLFASMAASNAGLFTRATTLSLNPNLELLFQEPQLRQFMFTFLLTAVNDAESKTIKSIIKFFKFYMAPRVAGSALFLKSPYVFFIDYHNKNKQEHLGINKIAPKDYAKKACALINLSTDYTPLGSYMTYNGGDNDMVAYRINLSFREIVPVYDIDYIDENHPIGY